MEDPVDAQALITAAIQGAAEAHAGDLRAGAVSAAPETMRAKTSPIVAPNHDDRPESVLRGTGTEVETGGDDAADA